MSFFGVGSNPFSTAVGQKIEEATSDALTSEDWGKYMEICDMVCRLETGPKDAVKALKKRLSMQPKNYTSIMFSLTVLETCVKNCGRPLHVLVCSKEFLQELVKLIGPKNDPPVAVQEKVLGLIESWAEAFRHQPDLAGVGQIYADLKHKGVIFPVHDTECTPPIITPQRSVNPPAPVQLPAYVEHSVQVPNEPSSVLTPENRAKLESELELVEGNAKILSEMINETKPEPGHEEDIQLMQDLHATCRSMQSRIVNLVGNIGDEFITDLLRVNDDLNAIFARYDEFMKSIHTPAQNQRPIPAARTEVPLKEAQLIDLREEIPTQELADLGLEPRVDDADFDAFAQTRTTDTVPKSLEKAEGATGSAIEPQKPNEIDEMELWLSQEKKNRQLVSEVTKDGEHISSSEFDRFLAERAAAAETLPSSTASPSSQLRGGNLTKEDNSDKSQFSL